jgi:S1-C subfamily serine protease
VAILAGASADHMMRMQRRLDSLEGTPLANRERVSEIEARLALVRRELATEVGRNRAQLETEARAERERMARLEDLLGQTDRALEEHHQRLAGWEELWSGYGPETIDASLVALRERLDKGASSLQELAHSASRIAAEEREKIAAIDAALRPLQEQTQRRDVEGMWNELVGPVVQLSGETTVGSGVLLPSRRVADGEGWESYLLTSWHVVRDIYGDPDNIEMPVPVRVYDSSGTASNDTAHLVVFDATIDVALLVMKTDEPLPHGADLPKRSRLDQVKIFDPVYAVGCPLGNDPIPTAGEIASTYHYVDGEPYWMISAPTYIGNSGGGIFDANTHELLGIFSKIYTHGSMRTAIVPHMGLGTPMPTIYAWLEQVGYGHLIPEEPPAAKAQMAAADGQVSSSPAQGPIVQLKPLER